MQMVYHKIAIDNWWSSRASSPSVNNGTVSPAINRDPLMRGPSRTSGSHVYYRRCCKNAALKCNMSLLIMDSPGGGGATAPWLTFLESSRRADVDV